jgi:beta-glucosidase
MAQSVGVATDYTSYIVPGADAALVYDIVVNAVPQGNVMTRIDCMYPCFGELDITTVLKSLPLNQKSTVKIPLSCFISTGSKGTDFTLVDVPFLYYTEKPFSATFANIRWQLGAAKDADALPCSALQPPAPPTIDPLPGPVVTLFGTDGSFLTGFSLGSWSANGTHVVTDTTTTAGVMGLSFLADGDNGITAISSSAPINLSNFATGKLIFELKVTSWGTNTSGLAIKMESTGNDCRNNDYPVPDKPAVDGQFHTITLNVADVAGSKFNNCFTLENIKTPFGIFPTWGDQQGVQFQVKNIRFMQ